MDNRVTRTSLYTRQETLKLLLPRHVAVVGCGGVGSWLAYLLALAGVPRLTLWDHDEVDVHNLNRLPLTRESVGKSKSEAIRDLILAARPECQVMAMCKWDPNTATTILEEDNSLNTIIPTTDTWASRREIHKWAMKSTIKYIEAAAEGEFGSITGIPADFVTEEESQPGYASVPVWCGPCVMAAAMAVTHVLHGISPADGSIRIGWNVDENRLEAQFNNYAGSIKVCTCGLPAHWCDGHLRWECPSCKSVISTCSCGAPCEAEEA